MEPRRRRSWVAAVLSFFLPGCGHLYLGRAQRFLVPLIFAAGIYITLGRLGLLSSLIGFTIAFAMLAGLFVFAIVDAFLLARRANPFTPKWYNRWYVYTPWALLIVFLSVAWPASRAQLFGYANYRVPGVAMVPTIAPGDYILVNTWAYQVSSPSAGDVVVVRVPETGIEYVRRVARQISSGEIEFKTDNPESMITGPGMRALPPSTITGRVTYVLLSPDLGRTGKRVE